MLYNRCTAVVLLGWVLYVFQSQVSYFYEICTGQVVWPKPTVTAFFGMLAAVVASTVESLGDYSACASLCQVPTPPAHAINRGIAVEGLGGVLSCIWGTGTGTASYSTNVVVIGITRVSK